jgi:hypothetical protein
MIDRRLGCLRIWISGSAIGSIRMLWRTLGVVRPQRWITTHQCPSLGTVRGIGDYLDRPPK